ncbi:MAG: RHS repeat-associated core domain-containing protein [Fimbriimonadaceae bacterium]
MIIEIANSRFRRPLCYFSASLMLTLGLPMNLFAYDPNKPVEVKKEAKKAVVSRTLSAKEMDSLSGRSGNPYYAGQAKFDVIYKGVNLRTGNYSMSATDLSFEGGYGIPVNITRSYSANNIDEGPFGVGWTLSADLRSTAGGLLKSSKAPVRAVPVGMKRRPSMEIDPNIPSQPVEAVVVTDADGKETTIQRDVDGVLTTPPWDKNEYETEYEYVDQGGSLYWILKSNKTMTPDGTVYQYEKKGAYQNGGSKRWDDTNPNPVREPNNVLKPVWVKDRHENTTTYTYGTSDVTFVKANGTVSEKPLTGVAMPNGRSMELTWSNNKITQIRAYSSAEERKVLYTYSGNTLATVQQVRTMSGGSPENGRITSYGYSGNLLTSMTDPRGLTTYVVYDSNPYAWYAYEGRNVVVDIIEPQGSYSSSGSPTGLHTFFTLNGPPFTSPFASVMFVNTYRPFTWYGQQGYYEGWQYSMLPGTSQIRTDLLRMDNDTTQQYFNSVTQDKVEESVVLNGRPTSSQRVFPSYKSRRTFKSNFLGNPLEEVSEEFASSSNGQFGSPVKTVTTQTAYWGEDKYFQQKAVKVTAGSTTRYSFTDYYDNTAAQGSKGQTYKVHDNKYGGIWFDTNVSVPSYGTNYAWKYQIKADTNKYSAKFNYDSKGRPTNVWKLQKDVSGTHQYVQTMSVYGGDNAPAYGNATQVTEDFGGASARTTQTLAFDLMGKAIQTQDGAGRVYSTTYDTDGNVLSVNQGSQNVVAYTYGTTNATVENGQPLTITDGLSGVTQSISYVQSGPAKGMPSGITEDAGSGQVTTTAYTYDDYASRETSTITTPNGTTRYKYSDYVPAGTGTNVNWVFRSINKQEFISNAWVNGSEEVRYDFDYSGKLIRSKFAMTPQGGAANYNSVDAPLSYVTADYDYDGGGRTLAVKHYWNQLVSGNYSVEAIRGSSASYATDLGLKASTSFLTRATAGSPNWSTVRTENYGYDQHFDYLTSVDYNDGLANEVQTWDYDSAGNRISASANPGTWTYDNLNRMSASPGVTYTHDAVGNRLTKVVGSASTSYGWDAVNRMVEVGPTQGSRNNYTYRADGMRVKKVGGGVTTRSYYDGQMPVEEDVSTTVTRNFIGARGIEAIETKVGSGSPTVAYPLYDTHGNMTATLSLTGSGTGWNIANERSYDVWGGVRSGAATGGPKGRYVANLGHVQDDESGLIYMRARYYEPETGRFVSEDRARDGFNWYVYCASNPLNLVDSSGYAAERSFGDSLISAFLAGFITNIVFALAYGAITPDIILMSAVNAVVAFSVDWFLIGPGISKAKPLALKGYTWLVNLIKSIKELPPGGPGGTTMGIMLLYVAYSGVLAAELLMMDIEAEQN